MSVYSTISTYSSAGRGRCPGPRAANGAKLNSDSGIPTLVDSAGDSNSFFFDSIATEQYAAQSALFTPICSHIFRL